MVELGDKKKHAHTLLPSEPALRVRAIETLLVEKGLIDPAAIDAMVEAFEGRIGPKNGARVVAKAWKNLAYKRLNYGHSPCSQWRPYARPEGRNNPTQQSLHLHREVNAPCTPDFSMP